MSIYSPSSVWRLSKDYNARRGEILDGSRLGLTTESFGWSDGKHCVHDGSVHHQIQKFLETQPGKRATVAWIRVAVPRVAVNARSPGEFLRELKKQRICERV